MLYSTNWTDYALLDVSGGNRLERWGEYTLIRPDPQAIWDAPADGSLWRRADAVYTRSPSGGGGWSFNRSLPESWEVGYEKLGLRFKVKPMGFKHTGLFPEQAANWEWLHAKVAGAAAEWGRRPEILNMFAYTGGASIVCAAAGGAVCHVDASKGINAHARQNAALCGLPEDRIRWITDDCLKFAAREGRRGKRYDGVILDPPSHGRGSSGEVWKIEDGLFALLKQCVSLLSETPLFILVNLYTAGLAPSCAGYMLALAASALGGSVSSDEIGLYVESTGIAFPCGAFSRWEAAEPLRGS